MITYGPRSSATRAGIDLVERQNLVSRLLTAFLAARTRQFEREITQHHHPLPRELEQAGDRLNSRNEDTLPFAGG
jgi:hypothetical protein